MQQPEPAAPARPAPVGWPATTRGPPFRAGTPAPLSRRRPERRLPERLQLLVQRRGGTRLPALGHRPAGGDDGCPRPPPRAAEEVRGGGGGTSRGGTSRGGRRSFRLAAAECPVAGSPAPAPTAGKRPHPGAFRGPAGPATGAWPLSRAGRSPLGSRWCPACATSLPCWKHFFFLFLGYLVFPVTSSCTSQKFIFRSVSRTFAFRGAAGEGSPRPARGLPRPGTWQPDRAISGATVIPLRAGLKEAVPPLGKSQRNVT